MSRAKKTKSITATEPIISKTKTETGVTAGLSSKQSLNYIGKATVDIRLKNKTIYSTTSHNNGNNNLFLGLAYAMAGSYRDADKYRPKSLILLGTDSENTVKPLSSLVYSDSTVVETNGAIVRLHFSIPYSSLRSSSGTITTLALCAPENFSYENIKDTILAEVNLENSIEIGALTSNTNLAVEWQLQVMNKTGD